MRENSDRPPLNPALSPASLVIFAGPQQHGRPGTRYIAKDGTKTEIISQAAKFYSFADALSLVRGRRASVRPLGLCRERAEEIGGVLANRRRL